MGNWLTIGVIRPCALCLKVCGFFGVRNLQLHLKHVEDSARRSVYDPQNFCSWCTYQHAVCYVGLPLFGSYCSLSNAIQLHIPCGAELFVSFVYYDVASSRSA